MLGLWVTSYLSNQWKKLKNLQRKKFLHKHRRRKFYFLGGFHYGIWIRYSRYGLSLFLPCYFVLIFMLYWTFVLVFLFSSYIKVLLFDSFNCFLLIVFLHDCFYPLNCTIFTLTIIFVEFYYFLTDFVWSWAAVWQWWVIFYQFTVFYFMCCGHLSMWIAWNMSLEWS